jgi:hypothetical protein
MAHDQLIDLLLIQIEQREGIVEVDGELMVATAALREVIENFLLAMLPADNPETAAAIRTEIEQKLAGLLPAPKDLAQPMRQALELARGLDRAGDIDRAEFGAVDADSDAERGDETLEVDHSFSAMWSSQSLWVPLLPGLVSAKRPAAIS